MRDCVYSFHTKKKKPFLPRFKYLFTVLINSSWGIPCDGSSTTYVSLLVFSITSFSNKSEIFLVSSSTCLLNFGIFLIWVNVNFFNLLYKPKNISCYCNYKVQYVIYNKQYYRVKSKKNNIKVFFKKTLTN